MQEQRIAKIIARCGICSRRKAEELIVNGRVKLNDIVVTNCATKVIDEKNLKIDDKPLTPQDKTRLWLYHKPKGLITSHYDPQNRPTIFANLPNYLPRVISIGRLDFNTEGLLLLTNDGTFARHMELPSTGLERTYRARIYGKVNFKQLSIIENGIVIDSIRYKPVKISQELSNSADKNNNWFGLVITEGKNREIRKIFEYFGLQVTRLIRIAYGSYQLGILKAGEIKEIDI